MTPDGLQDAHRLAAAGRPEALAAYRAILARFPDCADAANNCAVLLRDRGEDDEALGWYRRALAAEPNHADACYNLGRALLDRDEAADAVAPLRRAVVLTPQAERWHTLGRALQASDDLPGAALAYRAALRLAPDDYKAANNLANVLQGLGDPAAARDVLDAALARHPGVAELRYNRALALLLLGRWSEGFADYEARWDASGFPSPRRDFGLPAWDGAPAPGATLLLHWEQGLGDTIQFSRYVPRARQRVGRVVLLGQAPLLRLLDGLGADTVLAEGEALPRCDLHAPLLSLPHVLGLGPVPPLPPPPSRAAAAPPQVGLVWAGNPRHGNDRNRSLPPGALAPLRELPGIALCNLQLGPRRSELPGPDFAPRDFAETAAIVARLDLVIAVDTALAHLAATLGVETWLLLPFAPDWRWGQTGESTPWYPSMRLFRQRSPGRWNQPMAAIVAELRRRLTTR